MKCLGALVRFKVPQLDGGVGRARRCNAYARVCVCVHLCICLFVCLCACLVVGCKDKHKPAFPCLGSAQKQNTATHQAWIHLCQRPSCSLLLCGPLASFQILPSRNPRPAQAYSRPSRALAHYSSTSTRAHTQKHTQTHTDTHTHRHTQTSKHMRHLDGCIFRCGNTSCEHGMERKRSDGESVA